MTTRGALLCAAVLLAAGAARGGGSAPCAADLLDAVNEEDAAAVRALLKAGRSPQCADDGGTTPLMIAAGLKRVSGVRSVGGGGKYGISPRTSPAALEIVHMLLQAAVSVMAVDGDRQTALHKAASAGSIEVARLMIAAGSQVNALDRNGTSPLALAALTTHDVGMVRFLVEQGAEIGSSRALLHASASGTSRQWPSCCRRVRTFARRRPKGRAR